MMSTENSVSPVEFTDLAKEVGEVKSNSIYYLLQGAVAFIVVLSLFYAASFLPAVYRNLHYAILGGYAGIVIILGMITAVIMHWVNKR